MLLYRNVVDTAYLYSLEVEGRDHQSPSLREIAEFVLNAPLPNIHDSVEDARYALLAATHVLKFGPQPPLRRQNNTQNQSSANTGSTSTNMVTTTLLVHRVPDNVTEEIIQQLFISQSYIVPSKVNPIQRGSGSGDTGKAVVIFVSKEHADLAFETLPGQNRPDKQNKPQKRIYMKSGGYLCVRK